MRVRLPKFGTELAIDYLSNIDSGSGSPSKLVVQLPADRQRSSEIGYEPARASVGLNLAGLSRESGTVTGPSAAAAVLAAVFHRYTQQSVVALDLIFEAADGSSPRGVLVRLDVEPFDPVLTLVDRVEASLGNAPKDAGPPSPAADSFANVAISFGATASPTIPADDRERDLHFRVTGDGAAAKLEDVVYNAKLFRPETVARLLNSVSLAWAAAGADPTIPVSRLPSISAADLHKIVVDGDSGQASYAREPVYRLFEALARTQPEALAAKFQDQSLTYGELDARANQLGHYLAELGVRPDVLVAVCVPPGLDVLIAMLAVFKAGGIYLPLDPSHPPALLVTILDEALPRVVLTHETLSSLTKSDRFGQFFLDTQSSSLHGPSATPPAVAAGDDPLERAAYQFYTSGTTGKPKGVVASHRNLAHYINVAQQKYGFRSSDIFCSLARYTFSISMFELVSPLCCGGSVRLLTRDEVLAPDQLARILQTVTVVHAGPSLLASLFRHLRSNPALTRSFPKMRHASSGGDMVPPSIVEEMKEVFGNAEIFVIYGCTEISCMGCTYPAERGQKVTATYVGKAFPDVSVRLLDPSRNVVPIGVVGEICFSGQGVVKGYFNRPELTAEKFIELDGRRYYTTGDMGRLDSDGNVEILGRRDFQVQLRGIRVELAGIENTVRELGLASQCIVLLKKLDEQDVRLVAFLVNPRDPDIATFRRTLAAHLPDYMLPQNLVVLDVLPLTANGKVDRRRLQEMPVDLRAATRAGTPPRNAVERKIAGSFARVLGVPPIGIDDDFFDLGGHSLLAVTLLADLENVLGIAFPPSVIFEGATVRRLADQSRSSFSNIPKPIPLNMGGPGTPLYTLVGIHLYRELAKRLEGKVPVYAVYAGRELVMFESTEQTPSVVDLAREYVEIIRRHQPKGPYRLLGMSFGGIVAFEVAQQLRAAGEEIIFLGLLDAILPERGLLARIEQVRHIVSRPREEVISLFTARAKSKVRDRLLGKGDEYAEFQKYADIAKLAPLEDQRQSAYHKATEAYVSRLRKFVGNVTLVVAAERLRRHLLQVPSLGWKGLIPGLRVHQVESDHLSLLDEPKVNEVAEIILAGMARSA